MADKEQEKVIGLIKERACVKRDVYENLVKQFSLLQEVVEEYAAELTSTMQDVDKRLEVKFEKKSDYQFNLTVAGDILIFYMHSNVFQFDHSNHLWKSSYLNDTPQNSFTGNIHIYNFLADSFRLKRFNDLGYMIARIFINKEDHFMVEGQRQMGYLYNDYVNAIIDKPTWKKILESAMLYTLDFNLYVPPYKAVNVASVMDVIELGSKHGIKTGKRFGFQFASKDADSTGDRV